MAASKIDATDQPDKNVTKGKGESSHGMKMCAAAGVLSVLSIAAILIGTAPIQSKNTTTAPSADGPHQNIAAPAP